MSSSGPPTPLHQRPFLAWMGLVVAGATAFAALVGNVPALLVVALLVAAGAIASRAYRSAGRRRRLAGGVLTAVLTGAAIFLAVNPGILTADPTSDQPVIVATTSWPSLPQCDDLTAVAMPAGAGGPDSFHGDTDLRPAIAAAGGGSWRYGFLQLDLAAAGDKDIQVVDIKPHIVRRDLPPPAWAFQSGGGCGGSIVRQFDFDLDEPSFVDTGVLEGLDGATTPVDVPTEPLGPDFVLQPGDHAALQVQVRSCAANYEWNLTITYLVQGESDVRTDTLPSRVSYGVGAATQVFSGQDSFGRINTEPVDSVTGGGATC